MTGTKNPEITQQMQGYQEVVNAFQTGVGNLANESMNKLFQAAYAALAVKYEELAKNVLEQTNLSEEYKAKYQKKLNEVAQQFNTLAQKDIKTPISSERFVEVCSDALWQIHMVGGEKEPDLIRMYKNAQDLYNARSWKELETVEDKVVYATMAIINSVYEAAMAIGSTICNLGEVIQNKISHMQSMNKVTNQFQSQEAKKDPIQEKLMQSKEEASKRHEQSVKNKETNEEIKKIHSNVIGSTKKIVKSAVGASNDMAKVR